MQFYPDLSVTQTRSIYQKVEEPYGLLLYRKKTNS